MKRICFLLVAAAFVSGCAASDEAVRSLPNRAMTVVQNGETNVYQRGAAYESVDDGADAAQERDAENLKAGERAKAVSQKVVEIPGIDKAWTSITGNNMVVHIEISSHPDDAGLIALKKRVVDTVRAHDPEADHVGVSLSKELGERMRELLDPDAARRSEAPVAPESKGGKLIEQLTPPM